MEGGPFFSSRAEAREQEVSRLTKGQRILLWIVGIGAILLGLSVLSERFSRLDVADTLFILVAIGGGVLALFKGMSRGGHSDSG